MAELTECWTASVIAHICAFRWIQFAATSWNCIAASRKIVQMPLTNPRQNHMEDKAFFLPLPCNNRLNYKYITTALLKTTAQCRRGQSTSGSLSRTLGAGDLVGCTFPADMMHNLTSYRTWWRREEAEQPHFLSLWSQDVHACFVVQSNCWTATMVDRCWRQHVSTGACVQVIIPALLHLTTSFAWLFVAQLNADLLVVTFAALGASPCFATGLWYCTGSFQCWLGAREIKVMSSRSPGQGAFSCTCPCRDQSRGIILIDDRVIRALERGSFQLSLSM